jgi:carbamoyl-phosphate synthase large subunit
VVKKVLEGRPHIVDAMKNGGVQLVFNTTEGRQSLTDSFEIRRTALMMKIPYFTTAAGALAAAQAIVVTAQGPLEVRPLQSYS